jgi:phosphoadenosine phosphosulfate reductase
MNPPVAQRLDYAIGTDERPSADELRAIAETAARNLDGGTPQQVIAWAWQQFGSRVLISQSMANTNIAHLVHTVAPDIPVIFLDTGFHFEETIQTRNDLAQRFGLTIIDVTPRQTVAEQDAEYGPELWRTNPDLCCKLRKVEPMEEMLLGYDAWITGMRIATAPHREGTPVVSFDEKRGVVKIAPLLHWSDDQCLAYTLENDTVVNPLMYQGYPSIGCAPCTHPVAEGDDPRSGRWRGIPKNECGLHQ